MQSFFLDQFISKQFHTFGKHFKQAGYLKLKSQHKNIIRNQLCNQNGGTNALARNPRSIRVNSGKFGHQVNLDTHLQTV